MKSVFSKKNLITISAIIILDILIIGAWTLYFKPSEDMSIALIFIIPMVFLVNLIIGSMLYFIKKYYTPFFMLNAFMSSLLLFFFFVLYIEIDRKMTYESWIFSIDNVEYDISYLQNGDNEYKITYSSERGSSMGNSHDRGIVHKKNDTIYYDAFGRLKIIKDHNGKKEKIICIITRNDRSIPAIIYQVIPKGCLKCFDCILDSFLF